MQPQSKILIVDDYPANVEILKKIFGSHYELATAASGDEALVEARDFRPDIILLDVMMPGMDGYETCRQLRATPDLAHTKILMVSAKARLEERLQGYDAGADDYIIKPFDPHELRAKVNVYAQLKSLQEVDRLKSNILSLLNHELRTPLNSVLGPLQLLRRKRDLSPLKQQELLETAYHSVTNLNELIEKTMLLVELKAGLRDLRLMSSRLESIVRQSIDDVTPQALERDIDIQLDAADVSAIHADRALLGRVVVTLLENAIRFSPASESVRVCVGEAGANVCLTVQDRGKGIEPDILPSLFEGLVTTDSLHHRDGQGLNLAIASQIMRRHGGRIEVESQVGAGSMFTLRLPVEPA
ncbi:hybrid sensor histidine kinase/response regulator [Candidatus Entotheonella palauensis]|uniref:hybrid sensor histidine kinase/response regulator n=1 Tax=Candidatus Entotheonella palauensis TaxID=93172 RepID=UPI000B7DACC9|nr:hybrid sensor histidine kinase/response regulator [Candidatus Entotheonella palauensis]